jgi:hypothetical protein
MREWIHQDGTTTSEGIIKHCCEIEYLKDLAYNQLIDDAFYPLESGSKRYTMSGEKFMDLRLSPKRFAEYLYIIIKIGDEPLTESEEEWFDYVRSLPNDTSPVIINCVICRVPRDQLHAAMNGKNSMENRLW